jgi:hypothetical protein
MPSPLPRLWSSKVWDQIMDAPALRQAITVAASNIAELFDELIPVMAKDKLLEGEYILFCNNRMEAYGPASCPEHAEFLYYWEACRAIFMLYDDLASMPDWLLEKLAEMMIQPAIIEGLDLELTVKNKLGEICMFLKSIAEYELEKAPYPYPSTP